MERQNGKMKLLHLLRILITETDKNHPITVNQIITKLADNGITAERKSLYSDFAALRECGYDVKSVRSKDVGYYLEENPLTYEDTEAFWDILHAQNIFDDETVNNLRRKLEKCVSVYERKKLRNRIYSTNRVSIRSKAFKRSLDVMHEAIALKRKISFTYSDPILNFEDTRKKKHSFVVSPYVISCNMGRFFLIAGSEEVEGLSHFYIDRIENVQITRQFATDVREIAGDLDFDLNCYSKGLFEEYSFMVQPVILNCDKSMLSTITSVFDVKEMKYLEENKYEVSFETEISEELLAWLFVNHSSVQIISPQSLKESMVNAAKSIYISYI